MRGGPAGTDAKSVGPLGRPGRVSDKKPRHVDTESRTTCYSRGCQTWTIRREFAILDRCRAIPHNQPSPRYSRSIFLVKYLNCKDSLRGDVTVSKKRPQKADCGDPGLLGREIGIATMRYHNTVAARLGLNPTDHRCLDLLHGQGEVTAGGLAEWTGLTTGAVTGMIDRLERAGFIRREAHPTDRRNRPSADASC